MTRGRISRLFTWRTAIAESDLPPMVRLVAYSLSLFMNEMGGSAWPSIPSLASASGLSAASVKRGTAALEKAGYLRRIQKPGLSTRYMATIPEYPAQAEPGSEGAGGGLSVSPDPAQSEPLPRQEHANTTSAPSGEQAEPTPRPTEHQQTFAAVVLACGSTLSAGIPNDHKRVGRVARELRKITPPDEDVAWLVPQFAAAYRAHWPGIDLTPEAMLKHWGMWRSGGMTPAQPKRGVTAADRAMQWVIEQRRRDGQDGSGGDSHALGSGLPPIPDWGDDDRALGE